jgi:hypothetical protein
VLARLRRGLRCPCIVHGLGAWVFASGRRRGRSGHTDVKNAARRCGAPVYLLVPEPGPVGVNVEPLGEEFGPSVLPEGLAVLFGLVTAPPAPELPVVVPFLEEPVVVPLAAEPPAVELPPAEPLEEPPLCASANVLESAKAVASAIVVSFIVVSLFSDDRITAVNDRSFQKNRLARDKRLLISGSSHLAEATQRHRTLPACRFLRE